MQLARGIKYIHEVSNLIHRDIKSPNLLLNGRGEVGWASIALHGESRLHLCRVVWPVFDAVENCENRGHVLFLLLDASRCGKSAVCFPVVSLGFASQLKISDFGMTLVGGTQAQNHTNQVGTLRWMAPEVRIS